MSKVVAREMISANDIAAEEDVVCGWTRAGHKFIIIENFIDSRIHMIERHMIESTDGKAKGNFALEVNRVKESHTLVEVCRMLMEDGVRLWVFPSADYAISWLHDVSETIQHQV